MDNPSRHYLASGGSITPIPDALKQRFYLIANSKAQASTEKAGAELKEEQEEERKQSDDEQETRDNQEPVVDQGPEPLPFNERLYALFSDAIIDARKLDPELEKGLPVEHVDHAATQAMKTMQRWSQAGKNGWREAVLDGICKVTAVSDEHVRKAEDAAKAGPNVPMIMSTMLRHLDLRYLDPDVKLSDIPSCEEMDKPEPVLHMIIEISPSALPTCTIHTPMVYADIFTGEMRIAEKERVCPCGKLWNTRVYPELQSK